MNNFLLKIFTVFLFLVGLFPRESYCQTDDSKSQVKLNWLDERSHGVYNVTTFSLFTFTGKSMNGMQTIFGYNFNPHISVGGGIGIERFTSMPMYDSLTANLSLMPVFADIRYTILKRRVTPVIGLNIGYKVLWNIPSTEVSEHFVWIFPPYAWNVINEYDIYTRGGLFITGEIGVKARIYKRLSLYCSVDYSLWSVSGDHYYWIYQYVPDENGGNKLLKEILYLSNTIAYTHVFQFRFGIVF